MNKLNNPTEPEEELSKWRGIPGYQNSIGSSVGAYRGTMFKPAYEQNDVLREYTLFIIIYNFYL